jgi:hypothetical protein
MTIDRFLQIVSPLRRNSSAAFAVRGFVKGCERRAINDEHKRIRHLLAIHRFDLRSCSCGRGMNGRYSLWEQHIMKLLNGEHDG